MFQNFENDSSDCGNPRRLAALRKEMRRRGLDGFIVPREDEFQGEYLPAANERLKWLTGFGGSAGIAIVLARKAVLFVDGRYILQAPKQIDTSQFDIVQIPATMPPDWLAKNLERGQTIGFDPRLHSHQSVKTYRKAVKNIGAKIKPMRSNPLDILWHDRPALPETLVKIHPTRLAGMTSLDKRKKLASDLKHRKVDSVLLTQPENIAWLLNIRATDVPHTPFALSFGLLHKNGNFDWFINPQRVSDKITTHIGKGVSVKKPNQMMDYLASFKKSKIGFDPSTTPDIFVSVLAQPLEIPDPCALPKACKTKAEIRGSINAHIRDGAALSRFLCWLEREGAKGGISEIDAAIQAEKFRTATGKLRDLSFDTISGSGPHGAIVHYRVTHASNRMLKPGELYLIDSGGQYEDGTTDVTRTVAVGSMPPKPAEVTAFTRVLKGHIALAQVRFPEATNGMQLDTLARAPLWAAGQDFDHGTGHGVGSYLSVHEGPQRIAKGGNVALQPGMIVSNEPGYYRAGRFGIRIENLQYVTRATKPKGGDRAMLGFEPLTLAPIDHHLIDAPALTAEERDWLNAYHAKVLKNLTPLVDGKTKNWLKKACKPL